MNEIDKQQEEKITDYMVRKQEKLVEEINKKPYYSSCEENYEPEEAPN